MKLLSLEPNAVYDMVAGKPSVLQRDNDGSYLYRYNIQPYIGWDEEAGKDVQIGWQCREIRMFEEPTCENIRKSIINSVYSQDARLDLIARHNAYSSAISNDARIVDEYKEFMQFVADVDDLLDCSSGSAHQGHVGVPRFVTARQFRLALIARGVKLSDVAGEINKLPEAYKEQALVSWEYAPTFERNNPFIAQLAGKFGFTDESLDKLFIEADNL